MEKVCHTCGSSSWPDTFVLCSNCQTITEHTYCMDKLIETDDGEICWVCEICEPRFIELSDSSYSSVSPDPEIPQILEDFQNVQDTVETRCKVKTQEEEDSHSPSPSPSPDKDSDARQKVEFSNSDREEEEEEVYDPIQPKTDPIWMGNFRILGEYYFTLNEMQAHMSNETSQEASAVATMLPVFLRLHLVPKMNIWPIKFKKIGPTVDNIVMYFFPESYRAERLYDHLVDVIIENELAMVAMVDGVELLIFSSRELPIDSWRYKRKYYLWGMLRRKKKNLSRDKSDDQPSMCTGPSILSTEAKTNKESNSSFHSDGV